MTQRTLSDLPFGARVDGPFLVTDLEARGTDNPFTVLTLSDASGRLPTAPFWAQDSHRIAGIARGDVVLVTGTVRPYRDQRQVAVDSIRLLPRDQVDWRALLPSIGDPGPCWSAVDGWLASLTAPRLRRTLALFYDDPQFRARYEQCPASIAGHHAQLGGLLKHTCEVAHIGLATASQFPAADPELVLSGALLHDIGKLAAYSWDGGFEMTVPGAVLGHVVLGALLLDQRVRSAQPVPCTPDELLLLQHLILSRTTASSSSAPRCSRSPWRPRSSTLPMTPAPRPPAWHPRFRPRSTSPAAPRSAPVVCGSWTGAGLGGATAIGAAPGPPDPRRSVRPRPAGPGAAPAGAPQFPARPGPPPDTSARPAWNRRPERDRTREHTRRVRPPQPAAVRRSERRPGPRGRKQP